MPDRAEASEPPSMTCEYCRAAMPDGELFCAACGCKIKQLVPGSKLHRMATATARYDRVTRDPSYARVAKHRPNATDSVAYVVVGLMLLIALVQTGLAFRGRGLADGGNFFMFCFGVVMLVLVLTALVRIVRYNRTPVQHWVGVVLSEREELVRAGRSSTRYHYATLQDRDGVEVELLCDRGINDRIAAPDIGVAFVKSTSLVDFIHFRD